ncbi:hypothetical protein GCM10023321_16950 [Pseudonocardia eucalypti]|uniref:NUDIX hydrolase n=1 Tax=Pseudonocardia eucalypti TaxID=648755 RepID=A0ABP9PRD0_9PSEU
MSRSGAFPRRRAAHPGPNSHSAFPIVNTRMSRRPARLVVPAERGWRSIVAPVIEGENDRWRPVPVPPGMPVARVYGWLVDQVGRVLLHDHGNGNYQLPGGTPEGGDGDLVETLRRQVLADARVTVAEAVQLGYRATDEGGEPRALVSMVGRIGEVLPRRVGPDQDRRVRRLMTSLDAAPALLGWRTTGPQQAVAAALFAEKRWDLPACSPLAFTTYAD